MYRQLINNDKFASVQKIWGRLAVLFFRTHVESIKKARQSKKYSSKEVKKQLGL
ncbi:MAG: hypothetical protein ABID04_02510 [Patescibacteria group bacterium]